MMSEKAASLLLSSRSSPLTTTTTTKAPAAEAAHAHAAKNSAVSDKNILMGEKAVNLPSSMKGSTNSATTNNNNIQRRQQRALSGSPSSRRSATTTEVERTVLNPPATATAGGAIQQQQQQHQPLRVAFRDFPHSPVNQSPTTSLRRQSSSAALTTTTENPSSSRPPYDSQVTLQANQKVLWAAGANQNDDDELEQDEIMLPTEGAGDHTDANNNNIASTLTSSHFTPMFNNGVSKIQLQRNINLYQAKLKKARRKLEEEQREREQALNAYLKYAVNAASNDERTKRKEEFQRRNTKLTASALHLEKKISEYKTKIERFSNDLAASTSSSGTTTSSGDSRAAGTTSIDTIPVATSPHATNNSNNKWKSFTLPPGQSLHSMMTMPSSVPPRQPLLSVKSVTGTATTSPLSSNNNSNSSQKTSPNYSASTVNLERLELLPNHLARKRDSTATTATVDSMESAISSLPPSSTSTTNNTTTTRLRDGKMAMSLRDNSASIATMLNIGGRHNNKSQDDSVLHAAAGLPTVATKSFQHQQSTTKTRSNAGGINTAAPAPRTAGSLSGADSTASSRPTTRWYHSNLDYLNSNNSSNNSAAAAAAAAAAAESPYSPHNPVASVTSADDEAVSVSSLGTGSRNGASGGDNSSDHFMRQKYDVLMHELGDLRSRFDDWSSSLETIREQNESQFAKLSHVLEESLWKSGALESQLADALELRRADTDSWRQSVDEMEERMTYQIHERMRDMQENIDRIDTRFALMEHTQAREKALLSLESLHNSTTQQMLFKLLNLVLAMLQFAIVLGSSAAAMIAPIFDSKLSFFAATLVVAAAFMLVNSVDELSDLLHPLTMLKAWMNFTWHKNATAASDNIIK